MHCLALSATLRKTVAMKQNCYARAWARVLYGELCKLKRGATAHSERSTPEYTSFQCEILGLSIRSETLNYGL